MLKVQRRKKNKGFTTAEMLITVAIIVVLMSVAFIGVIQYMRSMAQLERDGYAKEIFIAAQNHLVMAHEQGYPGVLPGTSEDDSGYGNKADSSYFTSESLSGGETPGESSGDASSGAEVRFFVVNGESSFNGDRVLDQMLPFAAVDETVRLSGSYVIFYQPSPALVLDVFYCTEDNTRYGHTLSVEEYEEYLKVRDTDSKSYKYDRRFFGKDRAVLGWYGGTEAQALPTGPELKNPDLVIENAERLLVHVTDNNPDVANAKLKLIITGMKSGKKKEILLDQAAAAASYISVENGKYTIILDDITESGLHFADLFSDFYPGEDLKIQAVSYNNSELSNIAYSAEKTTNSLFADPDGSGDSLIGNIRHLQNLSPEVSNVGYKELYPEGATVADAGGVGKIRQITDLDWQDFLEKIVKDTDQTASAVAVHYYSATGSDNTAPAGSFVPVNPEYQIDYDGQRHTISGIVANTANGSSASDAGLFGSLTDKSSGSSISNLMLSGFSIKSSGNAGALAGSAENLAVANVICLDERTTSGASGSGESGTPSFSIIAAGNAGGLVGKMTDGTVEYSAAALLVQSSSQNAGGLIGSANGTVITSSYSGGHTEKGLYDSENFNVSAPNGSAGGLVGAYTGASASGIGSSGEGSSVTASDIINCYSTCSASGKTVGGLVGTASGANVSNSYAAGLVQAVTGGSSGNDGTGDGGDSGSTALAEGALFGAFTDSMVQNCSYFEIINERIDAKTGVITYLASGVPSAGAGADSDAKALDEDLSSYRTFTGDTRDPALPYDPILIRNYQGKYSLKTIGQLNGSAGTDGSDYYVWNTHYGDWPSPEILFMNEPEG